MKNFKKVLALLVVAVLVIGVFAACGGNKEGGNGGTILIGCTGPLTGDASSYGISVKNGAQLAVDEINAAGGVNGMTLAFDIKDDKAEAADASTGYDALMDAGMKISLGSVTSGSCYQFATKAAQDNLFFITPSASQANIIETGTNAFRVCFGDPDQGVLAAEELTKNYSNIGAIYDSSDSYSSGIYAAFKEEMAKLGVSYKEQSFDNENNKDFSTQVETLKDCDVIFLPIYYTEAGLIAKACAAKGCDAALFGCDGLDGVADQLDASVTNKVSYITPFDVNSTETVSANFTAAYKEKYEAVPDQFAADGYDAVYAIAEAMKAAGVNDANISVSDLCDKVVAAITADGFKLQGATGVMTWDATGACTKVPVIVELQ